MAAIFEPRPLTLTVRRPPRLRVVAGGRVDAPRPHPAPRPAGVASPRLVLAAVVVAVLLAAVGAVALGRGALAGLAPSPPAAATSATTAVAPSGGAAARTVVEVRAGDTLWSIARRLQPSGDVRPLVDRLVAAHGSTALAAGDRIVLAVD